jgi:ribosomal protein S18 acetylase RimI-like enzyme
VTASVRVVVAPPGEYLDEAAQVWAEATAARDGDPDVAPLEVSRPVVAAVVTRSPRSVLLVALDAEGKVLGFAACQPSPGNDTLAQLRCLGVRPACWGTGLAAKLLRALPEPLGAAGFSAAELEVYVDNTRALRLYEDVGWVAVGEAEPHPGSGKPQQRYRLVW